MKTLILDFDNTICDSNGIIAEGTVRNLSWREIWKKTKNTLPIAGTIEMIEACTGIYDIIISTSREESGIPPLKAWLEVYGIVISEIYCRKDLDMPGARIKKENLEKILKTRKKEDVLVIEDNLSCIAMYRESGIKTFTSFQDFAHSSCAPKSL